MRLPKPEAENWNSMLAGELALSIDWILHVPDGNALSFTCHPRSALGRQGRHSGSHASLPATSPCCIIWETCQFCTGAKDGA